MLPLLSNNVSIMQGDLSNFPYTLISHSRNLKRFDAYWFFVGVNTNLFVVPTLPDVWRYTSFFSNKIICAAEYCYRHKSAHRNLTLKSTVSWMNIKDSCITPYFYFYSLLSITIATSVKLSDITTDGNFLKTSRRLSILRQRLFQESYTLGPEFVELSYYAIRDIIWPAAFCDEYRFYLLLFKD